MNRKYNKLAKSIHRDNNKNIKSKKLTLSKIKLDNSYFNKNNIQNRFQYLWWISLLNNKKNT